MLNSTLSKFILLCGLCITMTTARAQYVLIPDNNFGYVLYGTGCAYYDSIAGYYMLDTGCAATVTSLDFPASNVYSMEGLQYFTSLQSLVCSENTVSFFPALPPTLIYLDCSGDEFTDLGPLPPSLTYLDCSANQLDSLRALPGTLTTLMCAGNYLTTLPSLPSGLSYIDCDENALTSLPSLPAALNFFTGNFNPLTTLPSLPSGLTHLECECDLTGSLPALPSSLIYLDCSANNSLSVLPALPSSLTFLDCDYDSIYMMPALPSHLDSCFCGTLYVTTFPALPASLTYLECAQNYNMTSLPELPPALVYLYCNQCSLTVLPALPSTLNTLYCYGNFLNGGLPALPASLQYLNCGSDSLSTLPSLPDSLLSLTCYWNELTSLPSLPPSLYYLDCSHNLLTSLPDLPDTLTTLQCSANYGLTCLPRIYQNRLNYFGIQGDPISCMPNRFTAVSYDRRPDSLQLCTAASGCDFYYNLAGNVHFDTATSCLLDSLYPGTPITNMKVQLLQNGQVIQQFYTFQSGGYSFKTDSLATYSVTIDTSALPLAISCPSSGIRTAALSPSDSVEKNEDFGMICSAVDYGVTCIEGSDARPGGWCTVNIGAGNIALQQYNANCGAGVSGIVTTTLNGAMQYVAPAPGALSPSSVSGNVLTYTLSDLDSLQSDNLSIIVMADTNIVVGTVICLTTIITPSVPDVNPSNDTLTQCLLILDSWDPNSKEVYPTDTFQAGQWLTYTINFQNTGTDTAYLVVVKDTLCPYVDASTFQFLGANAKVVIQLFGNAMVFTFPHINLLDSAANAAKSTGWIQYKVKSKATLPIGTQVKNTASIYFDNNPAVVTNTTVNVVDTPNAPLGIKPIANAGTIHLYPNPNKGSFTLETSGGIGSEYTISDMLGSVIAQQTIKTDSQTIDLPEASEGVYALTVRGAQPVRFVVVR